MRSARGGAKVALVTSLVALSGNYPDLASAIGNLQRALARNAMAHGFVTFDLPENPWRLVYREVTNVLRIKSKTLDDHFSADLTTPIDALYRAAGVSYQDVHDYSQAIAALEKAPQPPD